MPNALGTAVPRVFPTLQQAFLRERPPTGIREECSLWSLETVFLVVYPLNRHLRHTPGKNTLEDAINSGLKGQLRKYMSPKEPSEIQTLLHTLGLSEFCSAEEQRINPIYGINI